MKKRRIFFSPGWLVCLAIVPLSFLFFPFLFTLGGGLTAFLPWHTRFLVLFLGLFSVCSRFFTFVLFIIPSVYIYSYCHYGTYPIYQGVGFFASEKEPLVGFTYCSILIRRAIFVINRFLILVEGLKYFEYFSCSYFAFVCKVSCALHFFFFFI